MNLIDVPIIGLHGKARAGKDTVGNMLCQMLPGKYLYALADPIRAMLAAIGIDLNDPYWQDRKEDEIPAFNASPRRLMQTLGTEWGRETITPDIWINFMLLRYSQAGLGMIVTDVRFEEEAARIRALGGKIIHVVRPDAEVVAPHKSERGLEVGVSDIVILNNQTLAELSATVGKYCGR